MLEDKTNRIIDYWNQRVTRYGATGEATLLDSNMRTIEVETVTSWLTPNDRVVELFCGNGVSTIEFAKHCESIVGIDLSDKMLQAASTLLERRKSVRGKVSFEKHNVLDLDDFALPGRFDTVVSVRGLINLPSWELQQQALTSIHRALPQGGKFILVEGSRDGLGKINELRKGLGLKPLKEPWYDNHFDTQTLMDFMGRYFEVQASRDLSVYFLISRVLYPLACAPEEPAFSHVCNTVARLVVPYVQAHEQASLLLCRCFTRK